MSIATAAVPRASEVKGSTHIMNNPGTPLRQPSWIERLLPAWFSPTPSPRLSEAPPSPDDLATSDTVAPVSKEIVEREIFRRPGSCQPKVTGNIFIHRSRSRAKAAEVEDSPSDAISSRERPLIKPEPEASSSESPLQPFLPEWSEEELQARRRYEEEHAEFIRQDLVVPRILNRDETGGSKKIRKTSPDRILAVRPGDDENHIPARKRPNGTALKRQASADDELDGLTNRVGDVSLLDEINEPLRFETLPGGHRRLINLKPPYQASPRSSQKPYYIIPIQRRTKEVIQQEAKLRAERAELEAARKRLRPLRRYDPDESDILAPLDYRWENKVDITFLTRDLSKSLATAPDGSSLYIKDFVRLRPGQWLNDEVVNSYLTLICNERNARKGIQKGQTPKYHAFKSFFFTNLSTKGYSSVARWATKAKLGGKLLLELESIFIPVNRSSHWTLIVITPQSRRIEYFDSFHGNPDPYINIARAWLQGELGSLHRAEEWVGTTNREKISPQQNNGYDCGVFAITTARMVAERWEPTAYAESDINPQRRRIVAELLNGSLLPWGEGEGNSSGQDEEEQEEEEEDELAW